MSSNSEIEKLNNTNDCSIEITNEVFIELITAKAKELILLSRYILNHKNKDAVLNRPFLGQYNLEAAKVEELLDQYGAGSNHNWYSFRKRVASIKTFSNVMYALLHIKFATPQYHLLPIEENFEKGTEKVIDLIYKSMVKIAKKFNGTIQKRGIVIDEDPYSDFIFKEDLIPGRLTYDKEKREVTNPGKTVVHLATEFLNQSENSKLLETYGKFKRGEYQDCVPDIISEKELRIVKTKFHNLQSLYDTYISDSNIETLDQNLPIMRGHISIIFHLLSVGTMLIHYYERHMTVSGKYIKDRDFIPISDSDMLDIVMGYSIAFANRYIKVAQKLCRAMIGQYAENGRILVSVPNYRGFHVRPSTLISKIVRHYGSNVYLEMGDDSFDASSPLELFRVNEKINAMKRQRLSERIVNLPIVQKLKFTKDLESSLRIVLYTLLEEHKMVVYEGHFSFKKFKPNKNETLAEYTKRGITYFLTMGKIDIRTDIKIAFTGDKRVLSDIKLLSEHGYGEDDYGNNIVLPEELSYLKR